MTTASALGTPRPWGRLWRDTDESPVFAPARRSYVLPHRLPPADSASCRLCPLGRPPVPSLARAGRRPSHGALAPGAAGPQQAKDSVSWVGHGGALRGSCSPWEGLGQQSHLSAETSQPRGQRPRRGTAPKSRSELLRPPIHLSQKPEQMSQVLGRGDSSWGTRSSVTPTHCRLGVGRAVVCPPEGPVHVPPSLSGHGRFSRLLPFPHSFPAASFTHPVLLKGALRRTNFL